MSDVSAIRRLKNPLKLSVKGFKFHRNAVKAEIMTVIRRHKPNSIRYVVDKLAQSRCIIVLRLPLQTKPDWISLSSSDRVRFNTDLKEVTHAHLLVLLAFFLISFATGFKTEKQPKISQLNIIYLGKLCGSTHRKITE